MKYKYFKKLTSVVLAMVIFIGSIHSPPVEVNSLGSKWVIYDAHASNIGWMGYVWELETAGTTGQYRPLEAIRISGVPQIEYRVHASNIGWMSYVGQGVIAGTTGQSRPIEAVQIKFNTSMPGWYVNYRVYMQGIGWGRWVSNNQVAGTTGQSRPIEAIQIFVHSSNEGQFAPSGWQFGGTTTQIPIRYTTGINSSNVARFDSAGASWNNTTNANFYYSYTASNLVDYTPFPNLSYGLCVRTTDGSTITQFDIRLNQWMIERDAIAPSNFTTSVFTHELGHVLRLGDNPSVTNNTVMYHLRDRNSVVTPRPYDIANVNVHY